MLDCGEREASAPRQAVVAIGPLAGGVGEVPVFRLAVQDLGLRSGGLQNLRKDCIRTFALMIYLKFKGVAWIPKYVKQ